MIQNYFIYVMKNIEDKQYSDSLSYQNLNKNQKII